MKTDTTSSHASTIDPGDLRGRLLDAVQQAIIATDSDGVVTYWNKVAETLYMWSENEAIGTNISALLVLEPMAEQADQIMSEVLEGNTWSGDFTVRRKDGTVLPIEVTNSPIYNETGELIGIVGISQDISERQAAQHALHLARAELEDRVAERTRELEAANRERVSILHQLVSAQENERRRLAREVHDQLGQQVTVLRLKLQSVGSLLNGDGELERLVQELVEIARHLDSEVDTIAWRVRPAALDDLGIAAALDHYVEQWSQHFGVAATFTSRGLTEARLDPDVETNVFRITQEALHNIAKHANAKRVEVMLEPRDGGIVLIVEDDGCGFRPSSEKAVGAGMGLAGMGERAALIGGTMEVESRADGGTAIYVSVPAMPV